MTAEPGAAVLTARRAPQHIRLFEPNDAYECLCILTILQHPLALPLALKSILDKQFLAVHTEPHETAESDQTHAVEA